jgi:hypothetical protein
MQWGNYNEGFLTSDEQGLIGSVTSGKVLRSTLRISAWKLATAWQQLGVADIVILSPLRY